MKVKITAIGDQRVLAEYDNSHGVRVSRSFFCDARRLFVYEDVNGDKCRYAFGGLGTTGSFLVLQDGEKLIDLIRREYRAMMRAERKGENRD